MPIPISAIENTAEDLMAKAAIEIPQDYLDGLTAAADTEKGDLASFVLQVSTSLSSTLSSIEPDWTTNMQSPSSPILKTMSPFLYFLLTPSCSAKVRILMSDTDVPLLLLR